MPKTNSKAKTNSFRFRLKAVDDKSLVMNVAKGVAPEGIKQTLAKAGMKFVEVGPGVVRKAGQTRVHYVKHGAKIYDDGVVEVVAGYARQRQASAGLSEIEKKSQEKLAERLREAGA